MIWPDHKIIEWAQDYGIDPFTSDCINPASIDLRISNKIRRPYSKECRWSEELLVEEIVFKRGWFLLCSTFEYVKIPEDAIGMLFLKSSTGRMGLEHLHAGYVDPGFHGNLTLELQNHWPGEIRVKPGKRILQLVLCSLESPCNKGYAETGHYHKQCGPTVPWEWHENTAGHC